MAIAPFGTRMAKPLVVSGGRDGFWPVVEFLNSLDCGGETDLFHSTKQFLAGFPQKGTVLAISDFFDEEGCERAVDMLRTTGHDLVLVQVHTAEELRPTAFGELMLEDAETGAKQLVVSSPESTAAYERNFLAFSERLQRLAIRNGGRFTRVSTTVPVEEFVLARVARESSRGMNWLTLTFAEVAASFGFSRCARFVAVPAATALFAVARFDAAFLGECAFRFV